MTTRKRRALEAWIAELKTLRARRGSDPEGRLLLDGSRLVQAALAAELGFERVVCCPELSRARAQVEALVARLEAAGVPSARASPYEFSRISYKADGVVAVVRHAAPALSAVASRSGLLLVLDGLSDPGNIGAVVRTANAWAGAGVLAIDGAEKLRHPKCVRASMGAIFLTPTCGATRAEAIAALEGREVVVLAPDGDAAWPGDLWRSESLAVVLGNEQRGVHRELARVATRRVALPMSGFVDSLNVSNAAAVVLWEAFHARSAS